MSDRAARFILSTGNLVGVMGILIVIGLYLADVIHGGWWWMAMGAYVAGYLPFAFTKQPEVVPEGLRTQEVLEWLNKEVLPKMPADAKRVLADILARLQELMPRLKEMESEGLVDAAARAQFKNMIVRLLPDSVNTYLRFSPAYARMHKLEDGKTAQQHLMAQLQALQQHVESLEASLMSPYVNQMLVNTRFLEEKVGVNRSLDLRS